jgi:hypothetical protein
VAIFLLNKHRLDTAFREKLTKFNFFWFAELQPMATAIVRSKARILYKSGATVNPGAHHTLGS